MTIEMKVTWSVSFEYLAYARVLSRMPVPGTKPPDGVAQAWSPRRFQYPSEGEMRSALQERSRRGWLRNIEVSRVITLTEPIPSYFWQAHMPAVAPQNLLVAEDEMAPFTEADFERERIRLAPKPGDPCPTCGAAMVQRQGGVECISDHK